MAGDVRIGGSCRGLRGLIGRRLFPFAALYGFDMRLDGFQDRRGRIPFVAVGSIERIAMQPGFLGEASGRHPFLSQGGADAFDKSCDHDGTKSILRYAAQGHFHTEMCESRFKPRRMERTPDERREILRLFIQESGLKIARWAKESGVDKNSIYNFLNGHSNALDLRTYGKLARSAEVPVHRLTGDMPEPPSPTAIWVVGHVQAGSFREAVEWDRSRWYAVDVPVPERFRKIAKALEVRGNSMNLEYRPGAIIIWVDMLDYRPPRHLDHVVVYAYSKDGQVEATVKELRVDGTKRWLWPRSDDPEHQQPIDMDAKPEGIETIEIKGIVIGDYRPREL